MKKKGKITLFVAMILSFSLCVSNILGLITAVQAADFEESGESYGGEQPEGIIQGEPEYTEPENTVPEQPQEDDYYRQRREEEMRQMEEMQRLQEEQQRQAEEAARLAAEEAQRIADEQQRQQEELQRQEEERIRNEALERAAQEAEEARKQAEADAAAEAARQAAEEEAKRAAEAAEKARQEEEARKQAEAEKDKSYGIRTMVDGGAISNVVLTAAVGDGDALVFNVLNVGNNDIDLAYGINRASGDIFSLSLLSGSTDFKMGDTDKFQIAVNPSAPAGTYSATIYFKDVRDIDDEYTKYINVQADITSVPTVTKVTVSPQTIKIAPGGQCNFSAVVQGRDGEVSQDVTWSISGMRSTDTKIDDTGILTVSREEDNNNFQVVATSVQDPDISGTANIIIQKNSYNINAYAFPAEGGIVTGGGAVTQGGSATVSAVPNKNFYFDGWYKDNNKISTATNYTIDNVQSNLELVAVFKQNYVTITAEPEHEHMGSVVGGGKIQYGGSTILSAKAKDGFVFISWKEGDQTISTDPNIRLDNVTFDRKIIAKFAKTKYNVMTSCNPVEGGYVTGGGTYNMNENVNLKAEAANGYVFQYWTINGQVVCREKSCQISKLDRDISITAVFTKQDVMLHTMTAGVATTGGTINPSGVITVAHGSNLTYTITPKTGFAILAVAVDGMQVGPVSSYTFPDIKMNHVIAAAFVKIDEPKPVSDDPAENAKKEPEEIQQRKVQKVFKKEEVITETVSSNNAEPVVEKIEETVVDIKEAAAGTAGDEYIQEMDFTDVVIPNDEEIEAKKAEITVETTNVLKRLGLTVNEVPDYINNGGSRNILESAFYEGYLDAYVDNQYAPPTDYPDYHEMTTEELEALPDEYINPSMVNLDVVVESLLTPAEVAELANDSVAKFNISLKNADGTIDKKSKKVLDSAVGQKPLKYFDLTMMKTFNGTTTNISELPIPLKVVIQVPNDIYQAGMEYSVLRNHNGELTVLPDLDDNPKTITFQTDRFSSYAIAEKKASAKDLIKNYAIGATLTLIIALICMALLIHHHMKFKKIHAMHEEITRKIREERQR